MSMMVNPYAFAAGTPAWQDGHYKFAMFVDDSPAKDGVSGTAATYAGNAASDTTNKEIDFDGTGDWATFPSSSALDPTTNWTVEFHANFSAAQNGGIFSRNSSGASRYVVNVNGAGAFQFYFDSFSVGVPVVQAAGAMTGSRRHYAIVRDGGTWRLYVDGVQVDSVASATAPSAGSGTLYIGTDEFNTTGRDIAGTVGRFLISDVARYPSGTTFTPPAITAKGEPIFTSAPVVTGNRWVGEVLTLAETDNGTSRTIQWKRDGTPISGETSSTYTQVSGDIGHAIEPTVIATNSVGSTSVTVTGSNTLAADPHTGIRSSGKLYVNNTGASGVVFSFATMTAPGGGTLAPSAGDKMVLCAPHGYSASTPSGWTSRNNLAGSNYNGAVFEKTLSSGDIAAGSVTITFAGNYYGTIMGVAFIGGTGGYRDIGASRNGSGASSRTVTTGGSVQAGDYLLLFGSARVNSAVTSTSLTDTLLSNTQNESSSICRYGLAGSSGAQSGTINYSGSPSGDYQALVAFAP